MRDVPKLSPLVAHRVHADPLSGLVFTNESILTICREGLIKIWARPDQSENNQQSNSSEFVLGSPVPKDRVITSSNKVGGSSFKKPSSVLVTWLSRQDVPCGYFPTGCSLWAFSSAYPLVMGGHISYWHRVWGRNWSSQKKAAVGGKHLFIDVPGLTEMLALPDVWHKRIMEYALVQIHILNDKIV